MSCQLSLRLGLVLLVGSFGCAHSERSRTVRVEQPETSEAVVAAKQGNPPATVSSRRRDHGITDDPPASGRLSDATGDIAAPRRIGAKSAVETAYRLADDLPSVTHAGAAETDFQTDPFSPNELVPPHPARAEAPDRPRSVADDAVGLTLQALEELALANNPSLAQGQALIWQAEGNWTQVGLYPNPVAGYTASEIGQEGEAGQEGAFVSQTLVTADKLQLNRAVASWDIERARWQTEAQRLRVLNDVRIRFYEVLGAQRTVEIAEELRAVAEGGVRVARERFEARQVAQPDVLQAEIQLNQVRMLLQNARYQEEAARRQLANVVGIPALPADPLVGDLEDLPAAVDAEGLWQRILAVNPVLESARAQAQRAQAQIRREQAQPIPDVETQFSVQYDAATHFTVANAQVGVALPIHNRNQGNISAAAAAVHRATANVARLELSLRDRLAEAYRRYSIARNQVEVYRDDILPKAEQNLELATAAYGAGAFDFLRVLTARQTMFETRVEYVASLTNLQQSLVELEGLLLTGGLGDPSQDEVNAGGAGGGTQPLTDTPKTE